MSDDQSETELFVARDGVTMGSFSAQKINDSLRVGEIIRTDFYWREGMPEWLPLTHWISIYKKLPFDRPIESPPSFFDKIFKRESKSTTLALLWDQIAYSDKEFLVSEAAIESINQKARCDLRRRCHSELKVWYDNALNYYLFTRMPAKNHLPDLSSGRNNLKESDVPNSAIFIVRRLRNLAVTFAFSDKQTERLNQGKFVEYLKSQIYIALRSNDPVEG